MFTRPQQRMIMYEPMSSSSRCLNVMPRVMSAAISSLQFALTRRNTMRLLSRAALAVAAILFVAPSLHAQASFSIAAGAAVPIGSTSDGMNVGYNVTGAIGIKPPVAPIGLRIDGMFNSMEVKGGGASSRIAAGTANVTLAGPAIPMGYLIGGVGMYNTSVSGVSGSNTDFGFNVGVGLKVPLTGFSTFAEARLHYINTDVERTKIVPITFGITF